MSRILTDDPQSVLEKWQGKFNSAKTAYEPLKQRMAERERLYRDIRDADKDETVPPHYNIVFENIEAQVESSIYPVKVTARNPANEAKAKKIEHRLNSDVLRMSTEELIDLTERTVPAQGGSYYHSEWDEGVCTHTTHGDIIMTARHPMNVIPQDGYATVEEMDYIFLEIGQSREYVERYYDVILEDDGEDAPEARSIYGESETAEGFVTVRIGYFKNEDGGIGKIVWCGETLCFYMEDYEARHLNCCKDCGTPESEAIDLAENTGEGFAASVKRIITGKKKWKKVCPNCGGTNFADRAQETEIFRGYAEKAKLHPELINGTEIPLYKPKMFPLVLQKSISVHNQLFGISDIDVIEDQQRIINECEDRIAKSMNFGGFVILPPDASIVADDGYKVIRPADIASAQYIDVKDLRFDISQASSQRNAAYEQARNLVGITDSYQGRYDSSAKSGIAKQASAAQAAGRLQSKRSMKAATWAKNYELWFKMILANDDDERTVFYIDENGNQQSETFWRYEFLAKDADGKWYWDDEYLFSCDTSLSLLSDRESLWAQSANDYASGAYGKPGEIDSLIMLWKVREQLHYPLAGQIKKALEVKKQELITMQAQLQAIPTVAQPTNDSPMGVLE